MEQRNFCIVGLGLLGGSYARGLTEAGCRVTAVDVRGEAIRFALDKGWIAQGTTEDARPLLEQAEAVVLGLYPHALIDWVRANARFLRPGTLVTDVCGVKQAVVGPVLNAMPEGVEFIASHPMAGKEVSGVEYADSAIFRPANFIITPTERNTPRGIAFARQLDETLGFAHIAQLSCAEHDRMIGYVSQLTHAIAVSLMNANGDPRLCEFTGDSFRDLTRIARINEHLWSELFLLNRDALCAEIEQFEASLTDLKEKLQAGDEEGLKDLFRRSTARRAMFDR